VLGRERLQEILRVEGLAGGDDSGRFEAAAEDALGGLRDDGRCDRVNVSPARRAK
jgi:hypothetical protein